VRVSRVRFNRNLLTSQRRDRWSELTHLFLVDPVVGGLLPALELLGLEPEGDLLLGGLDGVGAVADVAADVLVGRIR
jgi:hypothetical protein